MILLNETPPPAQSQSLKAMYARLPEQGMVHSTMMRGQRYEMADEFDDAWACPAVTWSVGGKEKYSFADGKTVSVRSAGALALAAEARYAYAASDDRPFRSSMIVFPKWITRQAAHHVLDSETDLAQPLLTRLFLPDAYTTSLMDGIAAACVYDRVDREFYDENVALLYQRLLEAQAADKRGADVLTVIRGATRVELKRRIDRAKQFLLENYCDGELTLQTIAEHACLSPYHLIRVFKMQSGATPMQFLISIRMKAAMRLLQNTGSAVADAAVDVGYSDRTAFSRAFTKYFGLAPSRITRPLQSKFLT